MCVSGEFMVMSRALFRFANLQAVGCLESVPHSRFGAVLAERETS